MRHIFSFILLTFLLLPVSAVEVDLSKAYVISSGQSAPTSSVFIGGVTEIYDQDLAAIKWLELQYQVVEVTEIDDDDNETTTRQAVCNVIEHEDDLQTGEQDLMEYRIRGTKWSGSYEATSTAYLTELHIKTAQNGFIDGEVIHKTADESANFLRVQVIGYIQQQYCDEFDQVKSYFYTVWQNVSDSTPKSTAKRFQLRFKRLRALEQVHSGKGWGSYNEYHLTLEKDAQGDDILIGSVGTPSERFTSSDTLKGNRTIYLKEVLPESTQSDNFE